MGQPHRDCQLRKHSIHQGAKRIARHGFDASVKEPTSDQRTRCEGHGTQVEKCAECAMPSTLITGANRGLGFEFARQYLADGWQVYAACRDSDTASEVRRLADPSDQNLRIMALDVTDP